MFNYIPLQWLFLFYFYSFLGWCWESLYVSILEKRFVNRGFMRGPFLPLYGSGGVMMLIVSRPFYDNVILVYIAGCIGATILEFVTAIVMETLFKVRYWSYSHKKFNYKGYICLESTLFWGVCTVVFSHFLQVPVEKMLLMIPYRVLSVSTIVITAYISFDFAIAFKTAIELRDILIYMEKAKSEMARIQKRLDVIIAFKSEEVKEGIESRVDGIGAKAQELGSGISSRVEELGAGIGSKVGELGSGISSKVGDIGSGITSKAYELGESISSTIGSRIDVLSSSLEKSFNTVREKISLNPSAYMSSAKEEVVELYTKYKVLMSRFNPPSPIRSFFDWYRNRTILDNTNMYSEQFELSLEELKEHAAKKRDSKEEQ